ncbi:MAG: class I SAM-dependent methyltransferase [Oscillospiraceae bacterium]|jgi:ubiquinone/menaquinone biosynthesis C-methylase UbiE|nr:class I SAM-dependent methyltransferase [Oscillospiraceae bacterium]
MESYAAFARYYDCLSANMDYKKRVEYLCTLLCDANAAPQGQNLVLDLACGTGTYSYALQARGYDVIGIDRSIEMLNAALEKGESLSTAPPLFLCQRLEDLDLYGTAQAAVCLTDSVNHITQPDHLCRFFKRLSLFLDRGGVFVFDVNTLHKQKDILANNAFLFEDEAHGVFCAWQNEWHPKSKTTQITLDLFTRDGERYVRAHESFAERVYERNEIEDMLRRAGFVLEHVYDELTQSPPSQTSQRLFFVARKKG